MLLLLTNQDQVTHNLHLNTQIHMQFRHVRSFCLATRVPRAKTLKVRGAINMGTRLNLQSGMAAVSASFGRKVQGQHIYRPTHFRGLGAREPHGQVKRPYMSELHVYLSVQGKVMRDLILIWRADYWVWYLMFCMVLGYLRMRRWSSPIIKSKKNGFFMYTEKGTGDGRTDFFS